MENKPGLLLRHIWIGKIIEHRQSVIQCEQLHYTMNTMNLDKQMR